MAPQCTNDDSIGPGVRGCRDDFDFTIKFERIFLSIIPASVFTTLSVARTFFLWRKKKVVNALWLQNVKLVSSLSLKCIRKLQLTIGSR